MDTKNKFPLFNKIIDKEERLRSSSNEMNEKKEHFLENEEVKAFFDVYHYRNGGVTHFRKKSFVKEEVSLAS